MLEVNETEKKKQQKKHLSFQKLRILLRSLEWKNVMVFATETEK